MDWNIIIPALILGIPSIIAAVLGIVNQSKINEVHVMINSRFDQFMADARKASHAEGVKEEVDRSKAESQSFAAGEVSGKAEEAKDQKLLGTKPPVDG